MPATDLFLKKSQNFKLPMHFFNLKKFLEGSPLDDFYREKLSTCGKAVDILWIKLLTSY